MRELKFLVNEEYSPTKPTGTLGSEGVGWGGFWGPAGPPSTTRAKNNNPKPQSPNPRMWIVGPARLEPQCLTHKCRAGPDSGDILWPFINNIKLCAPDVCSHALTTWGVNLYLDCTFLCVSVCVSVCVRESVRVCGCGWESVAVGVFVREFERVCVWVWGGGCVCVSAPFSIRPGITFRKFKFKIFFNI